MIGFGNGVGEFNELQNIKYESMGLKITLSERQLNVLLKLFKQTSKTMQKTNKINNNRYNINFRGYSLSYDVCYVIASQIYFFKVLIYSRCNESIYHMKFLKYYILLCHNVKIFILPIYLCRNRVPIKMCVFPSISY